MEIKFWWVFELVLNRSKDLPLKLNAYLDLMVLRLSFILLLKVDLFFPQTIVKDVQKQTVTRKKFRMAHQNFKLWRWSRYRHNAHKKSSIGVI